MRLMRNLVVALALLVPACAGGKQAAPPAEPAAPPTTTNTAPMSPEDCTAKGGYVKGDIGDGKVACDASETHLGRVAQGIEGAVCCAAAKP